MSTHSNPYKASLRRPVHLFCTDLRELRASFLRNQGSSQLGKVGEANSSQLSLLLLKEHTCPRMQATYEEKSLGPHSVGSKDRNSREEWTLVEMRPDPSLWFLNAFFPEIVLVLSAHTPHLHDSSLQRSSGWNSASFLSSPSRRLPSLCPKSQQPSKEHC